MKIRLNTTLFLCSIYLLMCQPVNAHSYTYDLASTLTLKKDSVKKSETSKKVLSKAKKLKPYGEVGYTFFANSSSFNDSISRLQSPNQSIYGKLGVHIGSIPVSGQFIYNPNLPAAHQIRFNVALDQQKLQEQLTLEAANTKNFNSFSDSLFNSNQTTLLQKQLIENKIKQLEDSLNFSYSSPKDSLNDSLSIPTADLSEIQRRKQQLEQLKKQKERYNQTLNSISNTIGNDSLMKINEERFKLNKLTHQNNLDATTLTQKFGKFKALQLGTVFPDFSPISTYQATITGFLGSYDLSSKNRVSAFVGVRNGSLLNLDSTLKSTGLLYESDLFSAISITPYFIYNYQSPTHNSETINILSTSEKRNHIMGLKIKTIAFETIELGAEINTSENSNNPNTYVDLSNTLDHISLHGFVKLNIQPTRSRISFSSSFLSNNYINYLTPYLQSNSNRYKFNLNQSLFKNKLAANFGIHVLQLNGDNESTFGQTNSTKRKMTHYVAGFRTRWSRYPNYFITTSIVQNDFHVFNQKIQILSSLYRLGINHNLKIKKTRWFGEVSYIHRVTQNRTSKRETDDITALSKIKTKKITWRSTLIIGIQSPKKEIFANSLLYKFEKTWSLGLSNRLENSAYRTVVENGPQIMFSKGKFKAQVEYTYLISLLSNFDAHILNGSLSYQF